MLQIYTGVGVTPGRVIGPAIVMPPAIQEPAPGHRSRSAQEVPAAEAEVQRLKTAMNAVYKALQGRAEKVSGEAAEVLHASALMAKDPMLLQKASEKIASGLSAERAVWEAAETVVETLTALGGHLAERSRDVHDVQARILAELSGLAMPSVPDVDTPCVLLAEDLAPVEAAALDPAKVLALVTAKGSPQAHIAIIARARGLPTVVAVTDMTELISEVAAQESRGQVAEIYVDAGAGIVCTEPGEPEITAAKAWQQQTNARGPYEGPCELADGKTVSLLANIGTVAEALAAVEAGAEGVGLFRTEFLFLASDTEPSIDEQSTVYRQVFTAFAAKPVVIRTLDAGADKPLAFMPSNTESNPALGVRGYRTTHQNRKILERQLLAIASAANDFDAEVRVMAPMISIPQEAAEFKRICEELGLEIAGAMIEVPAAALQAQEILAEVDFLCLGTNDLTQYTMAADRTLADLAELNTPWQPAVLRLVNMTAEAVHTANRDDSSAQHMQPKSLSVCGEAAADPALAVVLVGLGIDTLSMAPRALPSVAAALRSVTKVQAEQLAAEVLQAESADHARRLAQNALNFLGEL